MSISDDELKNIAQIECARTFGDEWRSMFSGDQDAHIHTWIEGYKYRERQIQNGEALIIPIDLADRLLGYCYLFNDEGPIGCGWNSNQKAKDEALLQSLLQKASKKLLSKKAFDARLIKIHSNAGARKMRNPR